MKLQQRHSNARGSLIEVKLPDDDAMPAIVCTYSSDRGVNFQLFSQSPVSGTARCFVVCNCLIAAFL